MHNQCLDIPVERPQALAHGEYGMQGVVNHRTSARVVLLDETIGHLMETVELPEPGSVSLVERKWQCPQPVVSSLSDG